MHHDLLKLDYWPAVLGFSQSLSSDGAALADARSQGLAFSEWPTLSSNDRLEHMLFTVLFDILQLPPRGP